MGDFAAIRNRQALDRATPDTTTLWLLAEVSYYYPYGLWPQAICPPSPPGLVVVPLTRPGSDTPPQPGAELHQRHTLLHWGGDTRDGPK